VLGAAVLALAFATPALGARGQSLNLTLGLAGLYDDNVLEYSENQIGDFESGLHPLRYSIHSTGDGVLGPSVAVTWTLDQGRGRRHALRLRGSGDVHARNRTADAHDLSARWTESFHGERRFSAGYYRVADYYLRQLRDEDSPALGDARYHRATLDLQIASATWSQRAGRGARVAVEYQFENRRYVPEFRERDSDTHQGELRVAWDRLPRRGNLELRGGYRASAARGTDGDEIAGVRDDDDVSYHEIQGGIEWRMELGHRGDWRWGPDLSYDLGARTYESTLAADRYHFGRDDLKHTAEAGLRVGVRPHWAMRGFYRYVNNIAHLGTSAPPTSDSGSYRVNQVGLAIEWSGDLWNASRAQAEVDTPE
jgi:hypothetical protein